MGVLDNNYNLSKIISEEAIDNPTDWLIGFDSQINGLYITSIFYAVSIILYLYMRRNEGTSDVDAAVYTGLIMSVVGGLLFLVEPFGGLKLFSWEQYVPILVLTAGAIFFKKANERF